MLLWHFADNCVLFYKLQVCGSLAWSRSIGAIFPTVFAHFVSDFGNSHSISNFFVIIVIIVTVICHQ